MKTLVRGGVVVELIPDLVDGRSIGERYHPDLVATLLDAPESVQLGWIYDEEGGEFFAPLPPPLPGLQAAREAEVWAAIRAELARHYDQPWQQAASQLHLHYKDLLARADVAQEIKDQVAAVMPLFVQLWGYLLAGSSAAGARRVAEIRALPGAVEVMAYRVDLSDWVATDPQIAMSQITVPAALAILPTV